MKRIILFLLIIVLSVSVFAKEETLIGNELKSIGAFGGFGTKMIFIDGQTGLMVGGRGSILLNNQFSIGGGGFGLVSDVEVKSPYEASFDHISFDYGGLDLEYVIRPDDAVHYVGGLMLGSGTFSLNSKNYDSHDTDNDFIWVLEPRAKVELNIIKFFKIDIGLDYRFVFDVETDHYDNSDLSGLSIEILFKFGGNFNDIKDEIENTFN